jgi:hypothetical protein
MIIVLCGVKLLSRVNGGAEPALVEAEAIGVGDA